jgi:PncC family amidohydrolase
MKKSDHKAAERIRDLLVARAQSVAVAESVTAGQLQTAISMADNALCYFQGGITTYNIGQKALHLKVDPVHAAACDCVSEKIAGQMADNVAKLFLSDWGIAITGYASPVPEKGIDKLFACYSFYFRGKEMNTQTVFVENNSPDKVRQYYTDLILNDFLKILADSSVSGR